MSGGAASDSTSRNGQIRYSSACACSCSLTAAKLLAEPLGGGNARAGFAWCSAAAQAAGRPGLASLIALAAAQALLAAGDEAAAEVAMQVPPHAPCRAAAREGGPQLQPCGL